MASLSQFTHVVFPREERRRRAVNLVGPGERLRADADAAERYLSAASSGFLQWLFAEASLDWRMYRSETLQRRLPACLRALHATSIDQAREMIARNPAVLGVALSAMLIGVSSFFRDPPVFEVLRRQILPSLARSRRNLCIWSAACSDGAELYSLAFLLAELGVLENCHLLGTDCRADATQRAAEGCFDRNAMAGLPPLFVERYFERRGACWQVSPTIRRHLRWRTADILKEAAPGVWDLILFRNTAIYLRWEALTPLWHRLQAAVCPGGYLILGKAERPVGADQLAIIGPSIFQRRRR